MAPPPQNIQYYGLSGVWLHGPPEELQPDELQKVTLKEIHWLCDGLSLNPSGAFEERHPKIVI